MERQFQVRLGRDFIDRMRAGWDRGQHQSRNAWIVDTLEKCVKDGLPPEVDVQMVVDNAVDKEQFAIKIPRKLLRQVDTEALSLGLKRSQWVFIAIAGALEETE